MRNHPVRCVVKVKDSVPELLGGENYGGDWLTHANASSQQYNWLVLVYVNENAHCYI